MCAAATDVSGDVAKPDTYLWVRWECERCHRDVIEEEAVARHGAAFFDVRCPLCEMLTRFVAPPPTWEGGPLEISRSGVTPVEVH